MCIRDSIIAIGVAFLDFLPFFGTGTVLIPWAVIKFFSGDYKMVIGLLIIWGVGQLARQIIQPKIVEMCIRDSLCAVKGRS